MCAHVATWKKDAVADLTKLMGKSRVVGIIDVHGVPAPAFQTMRTNLRGKAEITMLKNTLLKIALEQASKVKKGLDKLAKGGEIAPDDIEIKAGETPFKPGPVVGELQKAGLPAAIEQGKVVIKKDKVLVKKGEKIPREVALVLSKLEIYPLTVGLDLSAAFEEGMVYKKDVLAVDETMILNQVKAAASGAMNLAVFVSYPTKQSIRPMLANAHYKAINLAVNANIANKETIKLMLAKANAQMLSLASKVPAALDDELKSALTSGPKPPPPDAKGGEGKKEEKKAEEKKVSEDEAAAGLGALF